MKVKIKKLKDLERKIIVSIPVTEYEKKYDLKIRNIRSKAKIDGFRKGNVPEVFSKIDMVKRFIQRLLMSLYKSHIRKLLPITKLGLLRLLKYR